MHTAAEEQDSVAVEKERTLIICNINWSFVRIIPKGGETFLVRPDSQSSGYETRCAITSVTSFRQLNAVIGSEIGTIAAKYKVRKS